VAKNPHPVHRSLAGWHCYFGGGSEAGSAQVLSTNLMRLILAAHMSTLKVSSEDFDELAAHVAETTAEYVSTLDARIT
jgi:hypothetical protein